ncbi:MAG: hypothetical protein ACKVOJ_13670 [Sphingomonadaceae bacterium]
MKYWLLFLVMISAQPAFAAPPDQADDRIRCVAALAILAHDQRNGGELGTYPPLSVRGARFAQLVGDAVMRETKQSREQVRDYILAAVAEFQKSASAQPNPIIAQAAPCLARLNKLVPPPSLPHCAAIVGLAYDDVRAREGLTKSAKDLATIAAILAGRAREELRGEGKTEAEGDIVLGLAREAAVRDKREPDLETCFERARP